jgi:hypothetical protein
MGIVITASVVVLSLPHLSLAQQAEPRPPRDLAKLDYRLARTSRVRITTPSDRFVAEGARAGVEGITFRRIHGTSAGDAPLNPTPIPWEQTLRVDVPSNHALGAALYTGLVVAVIAGAGTYAAGQRGEEGGPGGMIAVPVAVVLAAGVGALIPAWNPVYRKHR